MFVLKDSNLQNQLDDISNGEFSKKLDHTVSTLKRLGGLEELPKDNFFINFKRNNGFDLFIKINASEVAEEYDENSWNLFPNVMPPEAVNMRVERTSGECLGAYYSYTSGCWYHDDMAFNDVHRYRPWDDGDE